MGTPGEAALTGQRHLSAIAEAENYSWEMKIIESKL
jgi:hypothetical protein